MNIIEEIYETLTDRMLVDTQSSFSTDWCGRSKNYFAISSERGSVSAATLIHLANKLADANQPDLRHRILCFLELVDE